MNALSMIISRSLRCGALAVLTGVAIFAGGCESAEKSPLLSYSAPSMYEDEAFEQGSRRAPMPETVYRTAKLLSARGLSDAAHATLSKLIEEHPNYAPPYVELAALQVRQRRVGAAIRTLELGMQNCPEDAVIANNLGMCLTLTGDNERALAAFEKAASLEPKNARYRSNQAMALGMLGRYDESLALYKEIEPEAHAHYNLGVVCEARDDHARAKQEFAKATQLDPSLEHTPSDR